MNLVQFRKALKAAGLPVDPSRIVGHVATFKLEFEPVAKNLAKDQANNYRLNYPKEKDLRRQFKPFFSVMVGTLSASARGGILLTFDKPLVCDFGSVGCSCGSSGTAGQWLFSLWVETLNAGYEIRAKLVSLS